MILSVDGPSIRLDLPMLNALLTESDHPEQSRIANVPGFIDALDAARQTHVEIDVTVVGGRGAMRHHAWVGETAALFLNALDVNGSELYQAIPTPPQHVSAGLAKLVGLRPRGLPTIPRLMTLEDVQEIFDGPRPGRAMDRASLEHAWRVALVPVADQQVLEDEARSLMAIRQQDHQWVLAGMEGPERVVAEPAGTVELWGAMSSIMNT